MLKLTHHLTAAIAALLIVTATFIPVVTVPPASALNPIALHLA